MKNTIPISKAVWLLILPFLLVGVFGCTTAEYSTEKEEPPVAESEVELSIMEKDGEILNAKPSEDEDVAESDEIEDSEIVIGPVSHNQADLEALQATVDDGKELWRKDPEQVLVSDKEEYGFYPKDKYALGQRTPDDAEQGQYIFAVQHGSESYIVVLTEAFPENDDSIWIWRSIQENKPQGQ